MGSARLVRDEGARTEGDGTECVGVSREEVCTSEGDLEDDGEDGEGEALEKLGVCSGAAVDGVEKSAGAAVDVKSEGEALDVVVHEEADATAGVCGEGLEEVIAHFAGKVGKEAEGAVNDDP